MSGLFDDVLTPNKSAKKPGLFDDLIAKHGQQDAPQASSAPLGEPKQGYLSELGSIVSNAFKRGSASTVATGLHSASDFIDQTIQAPLRTIMGELGLGDAFADPLSAAKVANDSLGVEREINIDRAKAQQAIGGRPTLGDFRDHPLDAATQYSKHLANSGAESLPAFVGAIALRNPELAAGVLGGSSGAQQYTDLRADGVDRGTAAIAGAGNAAMETVGESIGLPFVMGKGGKASLLKAMLSNGGQEIPTQLAQQRIEDNATGADTPILQQLGDALDAGLVGAGLGGAGHGLSVAVDAAANNHIPQPNEAPNAAPRETPTQSNAIDVASLPVLGDPAPMSTPAPMVSQDVPGSAPLGVPAEPTGDLDALLNAALVQNIPELGAIAPTESAASSEAAPPPVTAASQNLSPLGAPDGRSNEVAGGGMRGEPAPVQDLRANAPAIEPGQAAGQRAPTGGSEAAILGDVAGAQAEGVTRDKPLPHEREGDAPVGSWVAGPKIPGVAPADSVRQVMEVPIDQIDATEFDSAGNIAPEKRADASRYSEAMRNGGQFPNARGSVLPNGKIKLQDGHRRLAAAMENGATTMRVAVNPMPEPAAPATQAPTMQNRDRSRAASVSQMQDIRRNPDPERLGFSRDPNTGAPMVGAGRDIPQQDIGKTDTVIMASGRRVPVQYAVVEAQDLAASHDADGKVNPSYDAAPLKALNNGRTAGLQAAYVSGNTDAYKHGIAADAGLHGVSPEAIASKRNPVLVRLYDPKVNTGDMGAESNASAQLGLSPTEQAQTDARSLPDLAGLSWSEDGNLSPSANVEFFRKWFRNIGGTQAATLQDAQGRPNAQALQRVKGALVQRAYGDERLLTALSEDVNPDNRNVMNALVRAAPDFATLDPDSLAGEIRTAVVGGLELLREANAQGQSLAKLLEQGDLLGRNPNADAVARFMAANARSANRMAEAFKTMAAYADNWQRQAATLDVFGGAPTPTVQGALGAANIEAANDTGSITGRIAEGDGGGQPTEVAGAAAGDAFALAEQAKPTAKEVAPSHGAGLFGAPKASDFVDNAQRNKDAQRDGKTGTGRTDMLAGDGNLFAGRAPDQSQIPTAQAASEPVMESVDGIDPLTNAAKKFFGTTRDPKEAGYILPSGDMLDFSGHHYSDNHPSLRGQRSVDHRELLGENSKGDSLDELFNLPNGSGSEYMQEFMGRTGAMRVDFASGVASVMGEPSQQQIATLASNLRGDYAALSVVDPVSGRIIDDTEIDFPTPMKVRRFFDKARGKVAADNAPLFQIEQDNSRQESRTQPETKTPNTDEAQQVIDREMSKADGMEDSDSLGLRTAVNEALGGYPPVNVTYLRGEAGLDGIAKPGFVKRLQGQRAGRKGGRTAGLYLRANESVDGKPRVVIFTNVANTPAKAAFTAAHEVAGHHGLRSLLGDKLNKVLDMADQNSTVKAVADSMVKSRNIKDRRLAVEEALADLAAATRTGDWQKITDKHGVTPSATMKSSLRAAIDNFLRRLKALFGKRGSDFTDAQVRQLLENAWQAAQSGEGSAIGQPQSALESTEDQTQSEAFKKWFGDSKVVDADGKPLVVYHGSAKDFDTFDINYAGEATGADNGSAGFFFTSDENQAGAYAGKYSGGIYDVFLSIKNPKILVGLEFDSDASGALNTAIAEHADKKRSQIDSEDVAEYVSYLKRLGRDGIEVRFGEGEKNWIAFDPNQIKSSIANNGNFNPDNPSILESVEEDTPPSPRKKSSERIRKARADAAARREVADNALGNPSEGGALGWNPVSATWTGSRKTLRNTRENMQDKMISVRDTQDDIEAFTGEALPDEQNVYRLENLMYGRVGKGMEALDSQLFDPLFKAMRDAKVSPETLEEYLYARHAKERNADISADNPSIKNGSGMTDDEADSIISAAPASLETLAVMVDRITKDTRARLLASGIISQQLNDALGGQFQHYVPLRGKAEADALAESSKSGGIGSGIQVRGTGIRSMTGRASRAQNILGEIIGDAQRSVIGAEKARVGRALARLVLANPNPAFWNLEPVRTERAKDETTGEIYDKIINESASPDVVHIRINGQPYRVQIENVKVAEALRNVGADLVPSWLRPMQTLNRWVSATLTSYNPGFIMVNLTRDGVFGMTRIMVDHGPVIAAKVAAAYPVAMKALALDAAGKGESVRLSEFTNAGGKTGWVTQAAVDALQKQVKVDTKTGMIANAGRAAKSLATVVEEANSVIENSMRLAYFTALRDAGMSVDRAAEKAKDLTVNFNRQGKLGPLLKIAFLFYNPGVQGAHQVVKSLKNPKMIGAMAALATAQFALSMMAYGMRDEDDEPLANKVPDFVKERNLWMVWPGKDGEPATVYTLPMPYGFNMFSYMGGRLAQLHMSDIPSISNHTATASEVAADFVAGMGSTALQALTPIPIDQGMGGLIPTVPGQAIVTLGFNRDGLGRKIREENPYDKITPKAMQGKARTSEVFKAAAKGLNRIGLGDDYQKPIAPLDWAPEDIEYMYGLATGGTGRFIMDSITYGYDIGTKQDMKESPTPLVKSFTRPINEASAAQGAFYDRKNTIERDVARIRDIAELQGIPEAKIAAKQYPYLQGIAITADKSGEITIKPGNNKVYEKFKTADKASKAIGKQVKALYGEFGTGLSAGRTEAMRDLHKDRMDYQKAFIAEWNHAAENFKPTASGRISDRATYTKNLRDGLIEDGMTPAKADAYMRDRQRHHIIADNVVKNDPLLAAARKAGYDLDKKSNLIALPDTPGNEIAHNTSHPKYDRQVRAELSATKTRLEQQYGDLKSVPKATMLGEMRRIEDMFRKKIQTKDVPTKDGRLAVNDEDQRQRA